MIANNASIDPIHLQKNADYSPPPSTHEIRNSSSDHIAKLGMDNA